MIKEGKGTLFAGRKGMKKNKLLEQNKFLGKLFVKKSYRYGEEAAVKRNSGNKARKIKWLVTDGDYGI